MAMSMLLCISVSQVIQLLSEYNKSLNGYGYKYMKQKQTLNTKRNVYIKSF